MPRPRPDQATLDALVRVAVWELIYGCGELAIPGIERLLAQGAVFRSGRDPK